jgi:ATP-dependent DNA helicase DinG
VVEAGTGVGKTFSYLVPGAAERRRVLLSTATKDPAGPAVRPRPATGWWRRWGLPVRTALLKGRASYLCLHRLELARHGRQRCQIAPQFSALAKVEQWAQTTRSGDLAKCPAWTSARPVIPLVTSTRENCLGSQCPKFPGMPRQPRRAAKRSRPMWW